jgi:hypothetical protein
MVKRKRMKKDFLAKETDTNVSLSKFIGKAIKDVKGYVIAPFGVSFFVVSSVVLQDDTEIEIPDEKLVELYEEELTEFQMEEEDEEDEIDV